MRLAAALCALTALCCLRAGRARWRLTRALPGTRGDGLSLSRLRQDGLTRWLLLPAGLGAGLLMALAGPVVVVAVAGAAALAVGIRGSPVGRRAEAEVIDTAVSLDLLGSALCVGAQPSSALLALARTLPPAAGLPLAGAATALALGAEPARVWADVAAALPSLQPAARAFARAASSGAAVAEELFGLAGSVRAERHARQRRRMQRASVWLVLPLGLCFLPAFVLVAVVPVVVTAVPTLVR